MTEVQQNKRTLLREVGRLVEPMGYKTIVSQQMFVRNVSKGRTALHLSFVNHVRDFDVIANVAIRFDQIEDTLNLARAFLSDSKKRQTYSFGAELGNISGAGQNRWTVQSGEDVYKVSHDIFSEFQRVGIPFFESISTIEKAYHLLIGPTEQAQLYLAPHERRASAIVAAAKVLGKENLEQLAREQLLWLQKVGDPEIPRYMQFLRSADIIL